MKLWSRALIALMIVNFCCALSFYLIMVKVTEFAVDTYGVAYVAAGTVQTAYVISALVARLVFGRKIDQWGIRKSLIVGSLVNTVATAAYLLPLPFTGLICARVFHGFGFAVLSGAAMSGAALIIPRERFGEGIGYFSMMTALATGVGPFVAILVTGAFGGYTPMFLTALVVSALPLLVLPLLNVPVLKEPRVDATEAKPAGFRLADFVQFAVVSLAAVQLLCYFGYAGIISYVTMYASSLGFADAAGVFFVVYAAVILVSRPPVGRRVDKAGENSVIYFCFAALVVGFVLLAFTVNVGMFLFSAALLGFGIGAAQSIIQAVIAREAPPSEIGRANSTFMMSMDLGSGVGPVLIGSIIPFLGFGGSYLVLACIAFAAAILYHLVHGRTHIR